MKEGSFLKETEGWHVSLRAGAPGREHWGRRRASQWRERSRKEVTSLLRKDSKAHKLKMD